MQWFNDAASAIALLWRRRGQIFAILQASEEMVWALSKANVRDIEDIHSLDPRIFHAMTAIAFAVAPPEAVWEALNKEAEPNAGNE